MGFWQTLLGTKVHCVVCGQPVVNITPQLERGPYCSEACLHTIERLSAPPGAQPDGSNPPTGKHR
jgi:hypothetical protein